jgi:hypothetical protein
MFCNALRYAVKKKREGEKETIRSMRGSWRSRKRTSSGRRRARTWRKAREDWGARSGCVDHEHIEDLVEVEKRRVAGGSG